MDQNSKIPEDELPSILEQYKRSTNLNTPLITQSLKSRFFYSYLNKIFSTSQSSSLQPFSFSHLYNVEKEINCDYLIEKFEKRIQEEIKENENPNFFDLLVDEVWPTMKISFYMMLLCSVLQTPLPILLKWYLEWFRRETDEYIEGTIYAFLITFLLFIRPILNMQAQYYNSICKIRAEIITRVRKQTPFFSNF